MDLGGAKRSRSPSAVSPVAFFAYFAAMGKVGRRRGGETPFLEESLFLHPQVWYDENTDEM